MIIKWPNLMKIFRLFVEWHLQNRFIFLKFIVIFLYFGALMSLPFPLVPFHLNIQFSQIEL